MGSGFTWSLQNLTSDRREEDFADEGKTRIYCTDADKAPKWDRCRHHEGLTPGGRVDGAVEQCQIAYAALRLQLDPNGPDLVAFRR